MIPSGLLACKPITVYRSILSHKCLYLIVSRQIDKITIQESNLSPATKKEYDFRLGLFYRFSPIKSDNELIDCPTDELQLILVNYARNLVKRVNIDDLSANTVPKMFRGIRWLLNSNYRENDIKWKPIEALFPKSVKRSGYKAWTTEQIRLMLENTRDLRNKAVIHFQASTGGICSFSRVENDISL
jgi:integrase/recombinase XerD